jgi:hypothetical protein
MSQYTFKTIVATEHVRNEFTQLRDKLEASDKQLMQALWQIALRAGDEVIVKEVTEIKNQLDAARAEKRQARAAARRIEMEELRALRDRLREEKEKAAAEPEATPKRRVRARAKKEMAEA